MLEPGALGEHFRIERLLGRGGAGEVYLAYDARLHRRVALKLVDAAADAQTSQLHLLREARNAAALNHPNICTVHEVGQVDGRAFIAMEHVDGGSLAERIGRIGRLPLDEVLTYGIQAADALACAHAHGVVHRDFKAGNVMLTTAGRLKVVDFGLARRSDTLVADVSTMGSLVPSGTVAGTPYAMAPEQVRGEPAGTGSDLWALGVLLYEMATGARPFPGATTPDIFAAILTAPSTQLPADVPVGLRAIIERCLEKDPSRRFASVAEVREALEAVKSRDVPVLAAWQYHLRRRPWLAAAAVGLAAAVALATVVRLPAGNTGGTPGGPETPQTDAPPRLLVLPFTNLTGDSAQDYFADGLTEEMISQLGRLQRASLSVIARSSAMQFKGTQRALDDIGRELRVDYILEGSVRREGSRVRINAALIAAQDGTPRWSESFDRELTGILQLQLEVARGIARALALPVIEDQQARLGRSAISLEALAPAVPIRGPVNPAAYDAYLLGQSHVRRLTRPELDRAMEYYESALRIEPQFALAHFGVSGVWAARVQLGMVTRADEGGRGRAALARATALDPTLPEVHMALAADQTFNEWNWADAEPNFRRAIDLNPSHAESHAFYSHYLYITGRPDEGGVEIQRAVELDPLNPLIQQFYGMTLRWTRRFEEGIAHSERVLKTSPNSPSAWGDLADNLYSLGRLDESLAAQRRVLAARDGAAIDEAMTRGYAEGGYQGAMRQAAEARIARGQEWPAAQLYVRGSQPERALDMLELALQRRNPNLPYIRLMPVFEPIRADARFTAVLRQMNLPR